MNDKQEMYKICTGHGCGKTSIAAEMIRFEIMRKKFMFVSETVRDDIEELQCSFKNISVNESSEIKRRFFIGFFRKAEDLFIFRAIKYEMYGDLDKEYFKYMISLFNEEACQILEDSEED